MRPRTNSCPSQESRFHRFRERQPSYGQQRGEAIVIPFREALHPVQTTGNTSGFARIPETKIKTVR
ncbi:MAG: hypothetical protein WCE65_03760 [Methanoregula sp.]